MAVFNLGSINIDHIYTVPHFPKAGETLATTAYFRALGGKGANQSIALAQAGAQIIHIGAADHGDEWLLGALRDFGVDITNLQASALPTGHAIVAVAATGDNQILLCASANQAIDMTSAIAVLDTAGPDDWVLLQNETNGANEFVAAAKAREVKVAYSAAPFDADIALQLLPDVDLLVVNEGEAAALAQAANTEPETIGQTFGLPHLVITRGGDGAQYYGVAGQYHQPAFSVNAVDTTGAGDCFFGYFLARLIANDPIPHALSCASAAAAIQVTEQGAAEAIPALEDVLAFVKQNG